MPDVEIKRLARSAADDPLDPVRVTEAIIHDGPDSHRLRIVSPDGRGYHGTVRDLVSGVIAEAYRLGKEAR